MRLKPTKLIVHKLGPFDHLELNWDNKDSRRTLIVAENGLGKTTLVAALAACLSFGAGFSFPPEELKRFASSEVAYAYLELDFGNEVGWVIYSPKSFRISPHNKSSYDVLDLFDITTTQKLMNVPEKILQILKPNDKILFVFNSKDFETLRTLILFAHTI